MTKSFLSELTEKADVMRLACSGEAPLAVEGEPTKRGSEREILRDRLECRCFKRAGLASMTEKRNILWFSEVLGKIKLVRAIENWP